MTTLYHCTTATGPGLPGYYPPTLRGEVSAAMVADVGDDEIPLPRSEPIPMEHEESAAAWVAVFGRELVACLFSRDWAVRETGLRRLAHEVRDTRFTYHRYEL